MLDASLVLQNELIDSEYLPPTIMGPRKTNAFRKIIEVAISYSNLLM